jgi:hypothetical protein
MIFLHLEGREILQTSSGVASQKSLRTPVPCYKLYVRVQNPWKQSSQGYDSTTAIKEILKDHISNNNKTYKNIGCKKYWLGLYFEKLIFKEN